MPRPAGLAEAMNNWLENAGRRQDPPADAPPGLDEGPGDVEAGATALFADAAHLADPLMEFEDSGLGGGGFGKPPTPPPIGKRVEQDGEGNFVRYEGGEEASGAESSAEQGSGGLPLERVGSHASLRSLLLPGNTEGAGGLSPAGIQRAPLPPYRLMQRQGQSGPAGGSIQGAGDMLMSPKPQAYLAAAATPPPRGVASSGIGGSPGLVTRHGAQVELFAGAGSKRGPDLGSPAAGAGARRVLGDATNTYEGQTTTSPRTLEKLNQYRSNMKVMKGWHQQTFAHLWDVQAQLGEAFAQRGQMEAEKGGLAATAQALQAQLVEMAGKEARASVQVLHLQQRLQVVEEEARTAQKQAAEALANLGATQRALDEAHQRIACLMAPLQAAMQMAPPAMPFR